MEFSFSTTPQPVEQHDGKHRAPASLLIAGALLAVSSSLSSLCFSQEVSLSALPAQMRQPIPDHVVYRMFLRHVAAFEREAQQAEANGQNPAPWRNHIVKKFNLTAAEYQTIAPIALQYALQSEVIHQQSQAAVKAYKALNFPTGTWPKGQPLPPKPTELISLRTTSRNLALQAKQQLVTALGNAKFSSLDTAIRYNIGVQSRAAILAQRNLQTKGAAK